MTGSGILAGLGRFGPFFALESHVESHPARSVPALPWRPLGELFEPVGLGARITAVRAALAGATGQPADTVELRVAASVAQLGLAARLICPALGVAVLTGGLLEVDPARMRWQPGDGGALALSVQADALVAAGTAVQRDFPDLADALADALATSLLAGPVEALVRVSRTFGVSEQVLWGNVASVVSGSVALIDAAEPGRTARAEAIVAGLLSRPPLRGTHQGSERGTFRRRSCCLMYRLGATPAPVCGDCVLHEVPASRTAAQE